MSKKTVEFYQVNMVRDGFTKKNNITEKKSKSKDDKWDKEKQKYEKVDVVELDVTDGECPCATCNHTNMSECEDDVCLCCNEECT